MYSYMYMIGLITLCSIRKHILLCLLSLEFIILSLFLMLNLFLMNFGYEMYMLMVFLTFSVCEGTLGLGVLIYLIRSHGNDHLNSFSLLMC
uniref:NADH-ubiquinone oxidoreductase chain 4L n=1 Tax=Clovia sp. EMHAU-2015-Zz052918 TaxID=2038646 RepID=A0A343K660_9HEMI|nr:NADH dehydrogenase subunit 4L [Clovia sp. EMHAU-2015-Zz052918]